MTLVIDAHEIIAGRYPIGKNLADLIGDDRRLIVAAGDAQSERFGMCFPHGHE